MERATCSVAPLGDVAPHVPREWRSRISGPKRRPPINRVDVKKAKGLDHYEVSPLYRQAWADDIDCQLNNVPYDVADNDEDHRGPGVADNISSCIPGALIVDPLVRRIVQGVGMRVTENAIWLLVVAVKAHTEAVLKNVVNIKEGLGSGQLYSASTQTPSSSPPGKSSQKNKEKGHRLIGASDMCTISAAMPVGPIESLGGSLSRGVFERCLHSSYDSNPVSRGRDFLEIQKFLTSEILASGVRRAKLECLHSKNNPPVNPTKPDCSTTEEPSSKPEQFVEQDVGPSGSAMAQRPSIRGLGRGAKNLAALKARASSTPPAQEGATEMDSSGRSLASNDESGRSNLNGNKQGEMSTTEGTLAEGTSQSVGDERDGEMNPGSSSPAMQARRGKGFGVKNLAAMRARSIQSPATDGPPKEDET